MADQIATLANVSRFAGLGFFALALLSTPVSAYTLYVSNEKDNTISIIDGESLEVIDSVEVGERPRGIVLGKDGKNLYICTSDEDHVEVLNLETLKVTANLPSGPDPELMQILRKPPTWPISSTRKPSR